MRPRVLSFQVVLCSGSSNLYQDFIVAGNRFFNVFTSENVGRTVVAIDDGFHLTPSGILLPSDINPKRHRSDLLSVSVSGPGNRLPLRFLNSRRHEADAYREVVVRSGSESAHWPGMRVLC
jgi:hypothetical protein